MATSVHFDLLEINGQPLLIQKATLKLCANSLPQVSFVAVPRPKSSNSSLTSNSESIDLLKYLAEQHLMIQIVPQLKE